MRPVLRNKAKSRGVLRMFVRLVFEPEKTMKTIAFLPRIATGALVASIVLTTGCGQAPTGKSSGNADQLAALEKENSSLKTKLANAQSHIDITTRNGFSHGCVSLGRLFAVRLCRGCPSPRFLARPPTHFFFQKAFFFSKFIFHFR